MIKIRSALKRGYQEVSRRLLTPLVYRFKYWSDSKTRLRGSPLYLPNSSRFIQSLEAQHMPGGYALFNTSILMDQPEGEHLLVTRISNARFSRITDWSKVKSFSAYSFCKFSEANSMTLMKDWKLLNLEGLEVLSSYRSATLEDLRLFSWNDRIFATSNLFIPANGDRGYRPCLLSLTLSGHHLSVNDSMVVDEAHGLDDPWTAEKNWCPLVDETSGELFLMRYFQPRQLYRLNPGKKTVSKVFTEEGVLAPQFRSPSSPIRVVFHGKAFYLGIVHSRREQVRNYEYAFTYLTRFYLLETTFPFTLVGMTDPIYFDFLPRGFLYPFQTVPTSVRAEGMDSVIVVSNLHDTMTVLFRVPLSEIVRVLPAMSRGE